MRFNGFLGKLLVGCAALVAMLLLTSQKIAWSQAETGTISGTVTDPSGAVVSNVTVTVRNTATNAVRIVTTDTRGYYAATNLPPGSYLVNVQVAGFQSQKKNVTLNVGGAVGTDFKLTIGAASTTIEVSGAGVAQVNVENATVGTNISNTDITQLPSATRNPYAFVIAAGDISDSDPEGRGVGVAINGQRSADTNVLLDGTANNDEFTATVGQKIPLDSVQEYSIMTSNWSAEYGRAAGGVVNLVSKSGTNDLHGTAYEFNRPSRLSSNDFFNNAFGRGPNGAPILAKTTYVYNDFGFSAGGPIKKNKLFFFANPEWVRLRSSAPQTGYVIDPAFIGAANAQTQAFFGAFGKLRPDTKVTGVPLTTNDLIALGALKGQICSASNSSNCYPTGAPLVDQYTYNTPAFVNGIGPSGNTLLLDSRVDWNISDTTSFYVRYALQREDDFNGVINTSPYAGFETGQTVRNHNALLSLTKVISPRWVSQSKLVFNRLMLNQPLGSAPVGPTLYLGSNSVATTINGLDVALPGYNEFTPGSAIPFGGPQNFYEAYEDMSFSHGSQTLRFGGDYTFLNDNRTFGAYEEAVEALAQNSLPLGFSNFMAGDLAQFQAAVFPQGKFPCAGPAIPQCEVQLPVGPPSFGRQNLYNELGAYMMDEWKVRPRFELNLGLRWDYYGVQHNRNPFLDSNYYDATGGSVMQNIANGNVALAPQSPIHGLWKPDYKNFGPRLGFAWDVFGDGKTSLRGGWGISYARNFGNVTFNVIQNPPNYAVLSIFPADVGGTIPVSTSNAGPLSGNVGTVPLPKVSLRNVNSDIRTAYAQNFSLSLEHQLATNLVVDIGYAGSKGARLYDIANVNPIGGGNVYLGIPCTPGAGLGNPGDCVSRIRATQYSNINRRGSNGASIYNSLNVGINMQNPRILGWQSGLTMHANYTWSHAFDDLSSTFSGGATDINLGYLDPFNPRLDRGPAEFDVTDRLGLSAIWDIPFASGTHGVARQILDGWEIAPIFEAQTGSPFSIFDCTNAIVTCPRLMVPGRVAASGNTRTLIGPDSYDYIDIGGFNPILTYANPIVNYSDFGPFPNTMTGRDYFRGPGFWVLNAGIYKNFKITERYGLQLRSEFYNIANHANLGLVAFSNATVGGTGPGAIAQFTGHRNVQLGAKFIF